jgi:flagellar protein FliS
MNRSNPWKSYREVATQTAPRGQLVLMLFDGALRFLNRALTGFTKDDPAEFNQTISNNVIRAQDIISELNRSLNLEAGGELAVHLRRIYDYLDYRLMQSNLKKETSGIQEAIERLTALRDAWATMLSAQSSDAVPANSNLPELTAA